MINKPTHFVNESSSGIDLIFSSNTSFVKNCGSELSIYEKCHHNIIYGTLNFDIPLPPSYYRDIWDYKNADTDSIQKAISAFDWSKAFLHRNVNEKCKILTDILLNVFKNFIPHKTLKCDYKTPDWMDKSITLSLRKRSKLTKRYYANPTDYNKEMLLHQVSECTKLMVEAKDKHLAKLSSKIDNPDTAPKTYWSIINRFLNNNDFEKKAELFNNHFASQSSLVKNASTIPNLEYKTDARLNHLEIHENDILSIIKSLNSSEAHGWDKISIRMIKLCGKTIAIPLKLIFRSMLEESVFPDDWKKSNVVPIHKRDSKNLIKNYRPISLLPIFSKIFERLIFSSLFNYFIQNKLFTECQSGFIPGNSCVAQLLSVIHEI